MKLLLTCDPGMEDVVEKEVREKLKAKNVVKRFEGFQGKVLVEVPKISQKVFKLHSIHHVVLFIGSFEAKSLDEISRKIDSIDLKKHLKRKKSFRVTTQRVGQHDFTSVDVQRVAGEVILKKYKKKVDLKKFDVNVRVDVYGKHVFVGFQLTKDSLYKRFHQPFNHPAGIKSTIAYGLLQLADIKKKNVLLDPMCGGGTITLEAASVWKNKIKIIGGDINKKYLVGARENAKSNKLDKYIEFKLLDARKLDEYFDENSIDRIVTNPPYGIRMKLKGLKELYKLFLISASNVLKQDGRIVLLTVRADAFRVILFRTKKYKIVEERVVESGGLYPHVFVLEKI